MSTRFHGGLRVNGSLITRSDKFSSARHHPHDGHNSQTRRSKRVLGGEDADMVCA